MDNDRVIEFLRSKRDYIESLRGLSADDKDFQRWHESLQGLAKRLGESYVDRVNSWTFWPMVVSFGGNDPAEDRAAYIRGLDEAEASIEAMIEEFELWGAPQEKKAPTSRQRNRGDVTLNLSISQQQAQQLKNEMSLEHFSPDVQQKVTELLDELQKREKSKEKIKEAVKWLADKSVDALIAILVAKTV
ncbi:MAG TPA: hypothetical protein VLE99_05280 [Candidatus Saccharimonadales bacterium]|nr:hypothetical protein [Candidatus Saccharimonadales bacterium]